MTIFAMTSLVFALHS